MSWLAPAGFRIDHNGTCEIVARSDEQKRVTDLADVSARLTRAVAVIVIQGVVPSVV